MQLIEQLAAIKENDESIFRRQLAKEDLARLEKLDLLFKTAESRETFNKDGLYIGWTQGDMRTHDLKDAVLILLDAFYDAASTPGDADAERKLLEVWEKFHRDRLDKLVHCL